MIWYLKIISTMVVKRFFCLKQKIKIKKFCTGCHKSAVRECKEIFSKKKQKGGKSQEISGMGRKKIFWAKGKKPYLIGLRLKSNAS